MADPTFDLEQLAIHLEGAKRHERLSKAIRRAYTVGSACADLEKAHAHLALVRKLQVTGGMPESLSREEGANLIEALFLSAIIIYARATVSKPIARYIWWSPDKLRGDLRKTHDLAIDLRNKEFAHFGKGIDVGGEPLLTETLYFSPGNLSPINFRSSAWATRPEFVYELSALIDCVKSDARDKLDANFRTVFDEVKRVSSFDNSLKDLLRRFEIADPRLLEEPPGEGLVDGPHVTNVWTTVQTRQLSESEP